MHAHLPPKLRTSVLLLLTIIASGCSTLPNGRLWGGDATLTPGWERVRESALNAGRDPWVWAPLMGSALIQIDDWDNRVSDWAREHTPVFGSTHSAEDWSDHLRDASMLAHYATVAATPSGDDPSEWIMSKARGTLVSMAAVSSTVLVTRSGRTVSRTKAFLRDTPPAPPFTPASLRAICARCE